MKHIHMWPPYGTYDEFGRRKININFISELGRVVQQWEPYYAGQNGQHKTRYRYDPCHRLDTVCYPNGTFEKTYYFSFCSPSAWTAVAVPWTTSSSSGCGAA